MPYLIVFLEGITTFISPCLLPMIPIYISYFAGGQPKKGQAFKNALGFVLGFTIVFIALGAFAGSIGRLLVQHQTLVNIISGLIVILFGLHFLGVFKFNLFRGGPKYHASSKKNGFFPSVLFGIVFSVGWTPCVGAFLGSALMLASQQGSTLLGVLMLLCYSLGLGIPFLISAVLIEKLTFAFNFIKRHYRIINILSGVFLIIVGILMMTGVLGYLLSFLSF